MSYVKGAKSKKTPTASVVGEPEPETGGPPEVVLSKTELAAKQAVLAAIEALTPEARNVLIDDILQAYCSMCSEKLDADGECPDGECPEGCDPDDLDIDDEDDEDDEDEEDEEDGEEEETL